MNEQLKLAIIEKFKEGMTYKNIGLLLGVTTNAVAGVCHRAGVRRTPNEKTVPVVIATKMIKVQKKPEPPRKKEKPGPVGFMRLNDHHCRWPMGRGKDGLATFCGQPHVHGLPYCGMHCDKAYYQRPR